MKIGLIPWRALQTNLTLTAAGGYIIAKEAMVAVALSRFNEAERWCGWWIEIKAVPELDT
jgi:hypothetical protein